MSGIPWILRYTVRIPPSFQCQGRAYFEYLSDCQLSTTLREVSQGIIAPPRVIGSGEIQPPGEKGIATLEGVRVPHPFDEKAAKTREAGKQFLQVYLSAEVID